MATKKVNIDIIAKDKSKQALNKVRGNLDSVKKSVFNLKNAFIGLGVGLAVRSLIKTGDEIENLQVRLKFLFGTAEEGAKAFDNMAKFASKVPFSLAEIQQGAGVLAVVSKDADELAKVMELTGNVAAVTGLDFKTTAEQIQRSLSSGIGAADLFREKGVTAMLGFKAGAKVSIDETAQAFERVFGKGGKFDGATSALADTFAGTLSMIGDKIFNFKRTILEEGFFPELKKQFKDLDNFLENESQLLDEIATKIGKGLAIALRSVGDAFKFVKDNADSFVLAIQGLIALKVATLFYGMTTALAGLTVGMKAFNFATKKNIIFGSLMVFAGALGFVITKFKEFKGELIESKTPIADLNKEITRLEKVLNNPKVAGTELKKQLKFARLELARLKAEYKDAQAVFNPHKGMTSSNMDKEKRDTSWLDPILDELNKELEAVRKKEEGINKILEENRQEGLKIFFEMQEEKERINNDFKIKEINDEIAHAQKLEEIQKNNFHRMLDNAHTNEANINKMKEESKQFTIDKGRELISELAKNNKKMFMLNKALSIRDAIMNTAEGVTKALASANIPLAFILGGLGAVQVATIAQQQYTGRQLGGKVNKGQPYMVGESGREMFVPNQNGNIVPNHDLKQGVNVNFNINTVDARGFNELLVNSRGVIVNMINSAVNEKGRQAII